MTQPSISAPTPNALSRQQKAAYIAAPNTCPFCHGDQLDAFEVKISSSTNEIRQPVVCDTCGQKWEDVYVLARIEAIKSGF